MHSSFLAFIPRRPTGPHRRDMPKETKKAKAAAAAAAADKSQKGLGGFVLKGKAGKEEVQRQEEARKRSERETKRRDEYGRLVEMLLDGKVEKGFVCLTFVEL